MASRIVEVPFETQLKAFGETIAVAGKDLPATAVIRRTTELQDGMTVTYLTLSVRSTEPIEVNKDIITARDETYQATYEITNNQSSRRSYRISKYEEQYGSPAV